MTDINLSIEISDTRWEEKLSNLNELSNQIIVKTFDYVQKNEDIDFLNLKKGININLCLSNDDEVRKLNHQYRDKDKATNVLSFANIDDETFEDELKLFPDIELGDIIIALETLEREAEEKKISLQDHYSHLFIHGILHLLGFDHIEDDEAEYMEAFEIQILQELNIKNPYLDMK
ncbi:MAG: rRNA maturation RNase YbeY [Alphaproteobacteria bacterium]|nr:rRNA maturation RNase YbeY [Alphaproteobacteria bacterium]